MHRRKAKKKARGKKVNYELIPESKNPKMYDMLRELINEDHTELRNAAIAIAWRKETKADVDGNIVLGRCVKISSLNRELADWNFVIVLNKEYWQMFTPAQQRALMDHELYHATVAVDRNGEPMRDERDRTCYRIRRHDLEEFSAVARRHGCYKRDLEKFAEALLAKKNAPLLTQQEKHEAASVQ